MSIWSKLTDSEDGTVNQEMVKKYKGTWVGIKYENYPTVYGIYRGVNDEGFHTIDTKKGVVKLAQNTDADVFVPQLEAGYYETENSVCYLRRNPYRQYRRGLSTESIFVEKMGDSIYNGFIKISNKFDTCIEEVLTHINTKDVQLNAAIETLNAKNKLVQRLNRDFMISLNHHENTADTYSLWTGRCLVGFVDNKSRVINLVNDIFKQELADNYYSICPTYTLRTV